MFTVKTRNCTRMFIYSFNFLLVTITGLYFNYTTVTETSLSVNTQQTCTV